MAKGPCGAGGHGVQSLFQHTCDIQGTLLERSDHGPIFPAQEGAAPPFSHFLLQPGPQLQVGFRSCTRREVPSLAGRPTGPGRLVAVLSHARWAHTCGVTRSAVPGLSRGWALARGQECPLAKMNERQPKPLPTSFGYRATNAPVGSSQTVGSVRYTGRREEEAGGLSGLCPVDTVTPPSPAHLSRVLTQKHAARLSTHVLRERPTRECQWWPCREKGRPSQLPHPSTGECPCRSDHLTTGHRPLATVWLLTALSMVTEPFANL